MAKLFDQSGGDLGVLSSGVDFLLSSGAAGPVDRCVFLFGQFSVFLATECLGVVRFVPLKGTDN